MKLWDKESILNSNINIPDDIIQNSFHKSNPFYSQR